MRWLLPIVFFCVGCHRPPETPEGLDQSLRYLFQNLYGTDEEVAAGLDGLLAWYDTEGHELLDTSANIENIGAFELEPLVALDVSNFTPRPDGNPGDASGVVAVAELPCTWAETEDMLVRPDQDIVFEDFDFYDRTYVSSRASYDDAREQDLFEAVNTPIDDLTELPDVVLLTENHTAATEVGVTIDFNVNMTARHGRYEVNDEDTRASLFVTWMPERAEAEGGANTMEQSYTFEVDLERNGETLWVYATWAELNTSLFDSGSTTMMALSAKSSQNTAKRMADICDGEVVLD
jgi:hypothetical protein